MNSVEQCVCHAMRISALVRVWDAMRGPGQALLPEAVDGVLAEVPTALSLAGNDVVDATALLARIARMDRVLVTVLKDPVYLNDDRDREIIAARLALCEVLKQLRERGAACEQVGALWVQNDCEAWCA